MAICDTVLGSLKETGKCKRRSSYNDEYSDVDLGVDIWINRLGVFCLWQKTKAHYSSCLRNTVNTISLFYFKYIYSCLFRHRPGSIAVFY